MDMNILKKILLVIKNKNHNLIFLEIKILI